MENSNLSFNILGVKRDSEQLKGLRTQHHPLQFRAPPCRAGGASVNKDKDVSSGHREIPKY